MLKSVCRVKLLISLVSSCVRRGIMCSQLIIIAKQTPMRVIHDGSASCQDPASHAVGYLAVMTGSLYVIIKAHVHIVPESRDVDA